MIESDNFNAGHSFKVAYWRRFWDEHPELDPDMKKRLKEIEKEFGNAFEANLENIILTGETLDTDELRVKTAEKLREKGAQVVEGKTVPKLLKAVADVETEAE